MAKYYRVSPRIWQQEWSDDAKLLALYLLTCSHRTLEGLYRLPKAYIEADLEWSTQRLAQPFAELLSDGFIEYDERFSVVLLTHALKYQRPDNPNQEKHALAALDDLPDTPLFAGLLKSAEQFAQPFAERLRERFGKPTATATATTTATEELIGDCPSEIAPPKTPTNDVKRVVYEDAFETWWAASGRTGSKADAHALWREWLKRGASVDDLQVAVERYVAHCASTDRPLMDGRTFLATTDKHRHEVNRWQEWADGEAHGSSDVHGDRRLMDVMTTAAEAFGLNGGNDNGNGGRKALGGGPTRAAEGRSDVGGGMAARELGAGE